MNERLRRERNERAWLAWHIAALPRQKKFPNLEKMLASSDSRRPRQTWQQQMAIMGKWIAVTRRAAAARGGK